MKKDNKNGHRDANKADLTRAEIEAMIAGPGVLQGETGTGRTTIIQPGQLKVITDMPGAPDSSARQIIGDSGGNQSIISDTDMAALTARFGRALRRDEIDRVDGKQIRSLTDASAQRGDAAQSVAAGSVFMTMNPVSGSSAPQNRARGIKPRGPQR